MLSKSPLCCSFFSPALLLCLSVHFREVGCFWRVGSRVGLEGGVQGQVLGPCGKQKEPMTPPQPFRIISARIPGVELPLALPLARLILPVHALMELRLQWRQCTFCGEDTHGWMRWELIRYGCDGIMRDGGGVERFRDARSLLSGTRKKPVRTWRKDFSGKWIEEEWMLICTRCAEKRFRKLLQKPSPIIEIG